MLESEAAQRWCPFVRTGLTAGMSVNRHVADGKGNIDGVWQETRCITDDCMAWRWSAHSHGYCGLAGKECEA